MAGLRRLTGLFLLLGALLLGAGAQQSVLGLVGSEVIMEPKYTGNPSEINWKINGNKLVEMELNSPDEPLFYLLQDRATIDRTNGVLTIKDLRIEDSGLYRAEVLVNSIYQYTDIILTVRACPDEPKITDESTEENIILTCESSTPGVSYEWFNRRQSVGHEQSYSEPQPKNDVTLTCVVDNEVCEKSSSIIIRHIPPACPDVPKITDQSTEENIVLYCESSTPGVTYKWFNQTQSVGNKHWYSEPRPEHDVTLTCVVGNEVCKKSSSIIIRHIPIDYYHIPNEMIAVLPVVLTTVLFVIILVCLRNRTDKPENEQNTPLITVDSESCGCISLNLSSNGPVKSVKLLRDGVPSVEAFLGKRNCQPQRIKSLVLTLDRVKTEDCAAEAHLPNGKRRVFTIKGKDNIVIIRIWGDQVKLIVPDAEAVTRLAWKKCDVPQLEWTISGVKLHTNKITLEPGSITIKNLVPGDSGTYEVDVHSADGSVTKNIFHLEVVKQGNAENVMLKVVRKVDPPEDGDTESQPIGSITFHPYKTGIWMKEGSPVNNLGERIKLGQNGDLTIKDVTVEDKGTYTVYTEDWKQQFDLCL